MSDGAFGSVPPEYRVYRAARVLNCSPWQLEERDDYWAEFALQFEAAEQEAQHQLQKQANRKRKR
jgi:hypothetical protein